MLLLGVDIGSQLKGGDFKGRGLFRHFFIITKVGYFTHTVPPANSFLLSGVKSVNYILEPCEVL
jgi:hypothetical protein